MHSDQVMSSSDSDSILKDGMTTPIGQGGAIYVYYDNPNNITQPKVICISTGNPAKNSNNTWYKAVNNQSDWTKLTKSDTISTKNPSVTTGGTEVTETDLTSASPGEITIDTNSVTPTIKLDKRPNTTNIRYRTKDEIITVAKTVGDGNNHVPDGYVRYTHTPNTDISGPKIKHNGIDLTFDPEVRGNAQAVYVYYRQSPDDEHHQFPLIVCVKINKDNRTYYKRGNTWTNAGINVDPDGATAATALQPELGPLIDKYEVKLDKIGPYKGSPQSATTDINVASDTVGTNFIGYSHSLTGEINRITHNGKPIGRGIPELDENRTITIAQGKKVWVFYEVKDGTPKLETPLLLYYQTNPGGNATNNWYGRGKNGRNMGI